MSDAAQEKDRRAPGPDKTRQVNDVEYVRREEALAMLGVKKESLYTYVSRGLIKTLPEPGKKTSLYRKADLEKLRTRSSAKKASKPVAHVLRYGEPIIQSWICDIGADGPRYRGHSALDLAREGRSFEYTADLIWNGMPPPRDKPWPPSRHDGLRDFCDGLVADSGGSAVMRSPIRLLSSIGMRFSALEEQGAGSPYNDMHVTGIRLLSAFAGVSGYFGPRPHYRTARANEFIAHRVTAGFGLGSRPDADAIAGLIAAALVLSVDHELSAPTFCARISASTGVDAYACVAAALMAQAGPMQAGGMMDVEDFLQEQLRAPPSAMPMAADAPCFGHPLYDKDPRAELLLRLLGELPGSCATAARLFAFIEQYHRASGKFPNLFAALTVLTMALGLPKGTAIYLHTLGRTAGWLAHIAEQRLSGGMLRPRARYMGTSPDRFL